jgi:amidase
MKRRNFIQQSGAAAGALVLASCGTPATKKNDTDESEPDLTAFRLNELTIHDLQDKMVSGEYTSGDITAMYLKRIESVDKRGPRLNSVIELNPDALVVAEALDQERKQGKVRGPLHGIPILIKDNIDTADKMMTTAGSLALEGHHASRDAFIIDRLRKAGAVLLGKTNLSEWANFRSTRSTSGWSSRGGQTKNPYQLDRNPCGSSSGTGAAVASNLCALGIGTETDGSIACPSSVNGIVGIKPTVGLWSRNGIIPISASQDTAGPMARTVKDAAILLGALTGVDPEDAVTLTAREKAKTDYTIFLDNHGLKGKRIGVEKSFLRVHEAVDALLQKALEQIKQEGGTIVEVELMNRLKKSGENGAELTVLKYEFKDGLNKYLSKVEGNVKSLKDVIAFNKQNESRAMPFFKQEILESSDELGGLDSKEYIKARDQLISGTRITIDQVLKENNLDAICGPANGPTWCTDLVNGDTVTGYGMYSPAAVAGYPSITVPMGFVFGLPVGLSFIGTAYDEPGLLKIAYAYEQHSKNRTIPKFLKPTV